MKLKHTAAHALEPKQESFTEKIHLSSMLIYTFNLLGTNIGKNRFVSAFFQIIWF